MVFGSEKEGKAPVWGAFFLAQYLAAGLAR